LNPYRETKKKKKKEQAFQDTLALAVGAETGGGIYLTSLYVSTFGVRVAQQQAHVITGMVWA